MHLFLCCTGRRSSHRTSPAAACMITERGSVDVELKGTNSSRVNLMMPFDMMAFSSPPPLTCTSTLSPLLQTHQNPWNSYLSRLGNPPARAQGCQDIQRPPSP